MHQNISIMAFYRLIMISNINVVYSLDLFLPDTLQIEKNFILAATTSYNFCY